MQFCVYFTLGLLVFVANKLSGDNYSLDHLFEYHVCCVGPLLCLQSINIPFTFQEIHIYDLGGRLVICAFVLNAFVASTALWCIVRRAKLCLDFRCAPQINISLFFPSIKFGILL